MESFEDYSNYSTSVPTMGLFENASYLAEDLDKCEMHNPEFNCSLEDFLKYTLGPQRLALSLAVPITVLYVLIFITGVVGNVSVCVVIVRNTSMHTATNYYLFSLAISDLMLLLLGLPNDISVYWHQYPYSLGIGFCKLRALLSEASSYVSVLIIVAFSMERYLAICHPLHLYTMSGLQRAVRIIAALWIVSLICAMPFAIHTEIHYLDYPPNSNNKTMDSAFCAMLYFDWPVWELSCITFFLLPAGVILVLYCRMGLRIRARSRNHLGKGVKGSIHGETKQAQSRKAIVRMLAAVVVAFFVCWAPFHVQRLVHLYGRDWVHFKVINEWLFSVAGWLYYVSSTVNPILYNVMSKRYRVAFRDTLCCGHRGSNGLAFSREQSSFRETTIAASGDGSHLVRVRSVSIEPIHRSGGSRINRHSTLSSTLSNLNRGSSQKQGRWADKQWNNGDFAKIKPANHNSIMSKYYNGDEEQKRKEITFEKETNNLLHPEDFKGRISDSRSDSQIMIKRASIEDEFAPIQIDPAVEDLKLDQIKSKVPSNGIKKFYPGNLALIRQQESGTKEECAVLNENVDESETSM